MKHKVILINPPLYYSKGKPYSIDVSVPPLGILYIASYVNKYSNDFEATVLDISEAGLSLEQLKIEIERINPLVIGITAVTPQLQGVVELSRYLKNNLTIKPKIILGGSHISADNDFINRYEEIFDYAIIGEGEKTFLESLNKLLKNENIPRIQRGEIILDLDTIPFPDKSLINRRNYSKQESLIYSRGCPYGCYYCSRPAISKKVRYRTAANMVEEIKQIFSLCDGKIDFQDDAFTLNKKRVLELCEEITKSCLKLEWQCNTRIDLVDEELLYNMKKAGCSLIHFGIESGNELIRKNQIHKNFTNQQIQHVFDLCRKYNIKIACYFMVGHPSETKETLEATRNMILNSGIDLIGIAIPTPFPGSELFDIAERHGFINIEIIDQFAEKKLGEGYTGNYPLYIPEGIEKEYLFQVMRDINRRFYFNFRILSARLIQDFISPSRFKSDITDFFYMIMYGTSSRKPYKNKKI